MAHVDGIQGDPLILDGADLVEKLRELADAQPSGLLAFDGDGTLWSGDVGEDVFHAAVGQSLLREEPLAALRREAEAHGFSSTGDSNEIAKRLFDAYLEHRYPERDVCAMMTWCYAGMQRAELSALATQTFAARGLSQRLHRELEPVFDFARARGLRTLVVSASPQPIVETAAQQWQLAAGDIIASRAAEQGGVILDRLGTPVPYADGKPKALRALVPNAHLLAAFGDNAFDVELFQAAELAVAVRPKPALRRRFGEVKRLCVLAQPPAP
ncbi:MAG: haloacid dehalogenase-like hydrolase [Polyangiaceae bacterium]